MSDASVIASSVDLTLVVVQHRRFPRQMLHRVKQGLTNVGAHLVGCVLNNTDIRHDEYYEYYTSYYQYYSPEASRNLASGAVAGGFMSPADGARAEGDY